MSPEDRARIAAEVTAMCHRGDWWHGDTQEALEGVCVTLVGLGVPVDRATHLVGQVKHIVANEYGE